ncbi:MAG: GTPase domain-containing protein [Lachnospiraceae bacterium]|nr:GTPase domain-containing protein [Lachnospiraceae bacterium]
MDTTKVSFLNDDKKLMQQLLGTVGELIKDSDAAEEKELVRQFLQKVSDAMTFVAIGDTGVGKSTFLSEVFGRYLYAGETPQSTEGIREIRGGVQEAEFDVNEFYVRQFRAVPALEGICIVDTQGIDTLQEGPCREQIKGMVQKSDVLFAIFDARQIKSFDVWDFLEETSSKKAVFVMTKCDLADEETLTFNRVKLQSYMQDADIEAPIFMTAFGDTAQIKPEENIDALKRYVRKEILGETPTLTKQQQNMEYLTGMLASFKHSYEMRRRQFEADKAILADINRAMDTFVMRNESVVNRLKADLQEIIDREIENYQNTMIDKMDPLKIKEFCPGGPADVEGYLAAVNDNYREIMNRQISGRTQETVRQYLSDLQNVFEEATGFFRKRQSLIALEDEFYGSLAVTKKDITYQVEDTVVNLGRFYQELAQASDELFMKAWQAREVYDKTVRQSEKRGMALGGLGGAGAGSAAVGIGALLVKAGTIGQLAAGAALWPVVGLLVGAVLISKLAKRMAKASAQANMYAEYQACVAEFKEEVAKIKAEMSAEIMDTITAIFDRELKNADGSFTDFRMTVNIDSRNIPVLECRMQTVDELMEQITQMKAERQKEVVLLNA